MVSRIYEESIIDAKKAKDTRSKQMPKDNEVCSMCGEFCAIKLLNDALKGNK